MATAYITIGCPTTGGGKVLTGNSSFLIEGIPIACIGDTASCPTPKTVATIVSGDPNMQVFGRAAARVNDSLSCGCKLLPKQNLVVGDTGRNFGFPNQNLSKTRDSNESLVRNSRDFDIALNGVRIDKPHFAPLGAASSLGVKPSREMEFLVIPVRGTFDKIEIEIETAQGLKKICSLTGSFKPSVTQIVKWDGFIDDEYDSSMFVVAKGIKFRVKGYAGDVVQSSAERTVKFKYAIADWVDTKINRKNNTVNHVIRLSLSDGGALGLNASNKIPQSDLAYYNKPPLTTQIVSFQELKTLAIKGVAKYWGRNNSRVIGKFIKLDFRTYEVFVKAIESSKNAMDSLRLVFVTNSEPGYSANWIISSRVSYNVGYLSSENSDFIYRSVTQASDYFSETFAHEVGHDILTAGGGFMKSKTHNKTSTIAQNPIPGIDYPAKGEIDLMMYGFNSRFDVKDFYDRAIANEDDVRSLIWIGGLKVL